jgi:immune inhibitor A
MSRRSLLFLVPACIALVGSSSAAAHTAKRTLAEQIVQPIPARNLYQLTDQLKLRPPRLIPHVIRTKSPNYHVGHQDTFQILSEDNNKYFSTRATIKFETKHLYIYVQDGLGIKQADIQRAALRFENRTYPTDRRYFGSEWTPGVDGDPHITCLVADLKSSSAIGYFSAEDEYPRLVNPYSNQREMVYLNSVYTTPGDQIFDLTLSHEFQHMIHWHMHPHDNGWLNEGMSMLAEKLNGFQPQAELDAFLGLPQTQLNAWAENGPTALSHYGAAYLFLSYLFNHYGAGVVRDMLAAPQYTDFELVNAILHKHHVSVSANTVFARWVVANYLRDAHVARGIYDYANLPRRIDVPSGHTVPFTDAESLQPYTAQYVVMDKLDATKPFTLSFSAPSTVPLIGESRPAPFWWSNRGDMSDTTLQRSLDLRNVHHATLHFSDWYDIEKDYDYGYVEASRDGGKTWNTLKTQDTTSTNPYGANYRNGFTGGSKDWRLETADLSAYAGHKALIRFQYITDDIYNGQGWLLSGISVPEIGFHDGFSGWQQKGFVPIFSNSLPASWQVRLIEYGTSGTQVHSLQLEQSSSGAANTTGTLRLPVSLGLQKVVAVVFYTAPKTTVHLSWRLSATDG